MHTIYSFGEMDLSSFSFFKLLLLLIWSIPIHLWQVVFSNSFYIDFHCVSIWQWFWTLLAQIVELSGKRKKKLTHRFWFTLPGMRPKEMGLSKTPQVSLLYCHGWDPLPECTHRSLGPLLKMQIWFSRSRVRVWESVFLTNSQVMQIGVARTWEHEKVIPLPKIIIGFLLSA